ncbi:MAG: transposase [Acidobacteria bacterium]|nr:transposase [Acidobacteriota bacterium]
MYITETIIQSARGKEYRTVLLRRSYRVGRQVKNDTLANLSHCQPEEIAALRLALKHKGDLSVLGTLRESVDLQEGPSVGAAWTVYAVARRVGIIAALGTGRPGKLALWQVMARVLDQGSRLSAVRLAQHTAATDILGLRQGFDENDLYDNLAWLADKQKAIERQLFRARCPGVKPELFLYDVTSSYFEGSHNVLAAWGYNRDKKNGKKQVVLGLLCDAQGDPVTVEVFTGNTSDPATMASAVRRAAQDFGCQRVTWVGDRGMIKSAQIADLHEQKFYYITAITKPQIETLLKAGSLQMSLFDEKVGEVAVDGVRYVLRRNPQRADEMARTRQGKQASLEKWRHSKNI